MTMNMLTVTLLLRTCLRVALVVMLTMLEAGLFSPSLLPHVIGEGQSEDEEHAEDGVSEHCTEISASPGLAGPCDRKYNFTLPTTSVRAGRGG